MKMLKLWKLARAYRRAWERRTAATRSMTYRPNDVSDEAIGDARRAADAAHDEMMEARRVLMNYLHEGE